jgi:hypothetical protein
MEFLGYVYDAFGHYDAPHSLQDEFALVKFINEYLEAPQMVVTDLNDNQLLLTREGVDFFSNLSSLGIELGDVYRQIHHGQTETLEGSQQKPPWEVLYDSIGVSPSEVRMRQEIKTRCLTAKKVRDVADLVTLVVELLLQDVEGYWYDTGAQVALPGSARVQHLRSSEDIHEFLLLDPPAANGKEI